MTAVDVTARARVLGIETVYADKRAGNVAYLPRRIAIVGQGESGVSYSDSRWTVTGLGAAGDRYGRRGPIYQMLKQLIPVNGDGVGTIPIDVLPLQDDGSGVAASGSITPSGTGTVAQQFRVRGAGVLSLAFVISAGALTGAGLTAACRAIHDAMVEVTDFPAFAGYTYGSPSVEYDRVGTSDGTLGTFTTTGGPKPGVWTITCTGEASNAGTFSVKDPDGVEVGTFDSMGAKTIGGLGFTISDGDEDWDTGDVATVTVPVTAVTVTTAWKGVSANDCGIEILNAAGESVTSANGVTFTLVQPTGGLVNPEVDEAIAQVGNVWVTDVINGLNVEDSTALDAYQTFGGAPATETTPASGRWGGTVHKPLNVYTGSQESDLTTATAITDARKTDCVNVVLAAPGSPNLPCVIAARQVARIAALANNIPSHDYGSQRATGLVPGPDGDQWDFIQRDQAVKAGHSTIEVVDGVVSISDVVTCYHPTGEDPPAYSYVVDIVKIQTAIYNFALEFAQPKWDGAALIPDDQATTEPTAKKPRIIKAAIGNIVDALGLAAVISDPATTKANTTVVISSSNPKRFDARVPLYLAGNTNIRALTLEFSFYFGTPAIAA